MRRGLIALAALLCLGISGRIPAGLAVREEAYRQNNVGLGLLEQYEYADAANAFRGALRTDPTLTIARINLAVALFNLPDFEAARKEASAAAEQLPNRPQPHYILGLIAKAQSRFDEAVAAFERVLALDPADVGANVNLGQIHLQRQAYAEAIARFRAALAAEPFNATAAYNLGLALTRAGESAEGRKMLERFDELRRTGSGTLLGVSYPEQGRYALGIASTGDEPEIVDAATPTVRFVDVTAAILPGDERRGAKGGQADGRATLFDLDGDGDLDILDAGRQGQRLLRSAGGRFTDITREMGLDPGAASLGAVAGDYDNDGWPDLLVLRDAGPRLYHNDQGRVFSDVTSLAGIKPGAPATSAAFADVDHDGDLDIFVVGSGDATRLLRNDGGGKFSDITAEARVGGGRAHAIGIVPTDYDNGRDLDLFVLNSDAPPMLFKNMRDGGFREVASDVGLVAAGQGRLACVTAADVDKDGYTDFFLARADGPDVLLLSDGGQRFAARSSPGGSSGSSAALFVDYDNDGLLDLVTIAGGRLRVIRNVGGGKWTDVSEAAAPSAELSGGSLAAGDVTGDGAQDLVLRLPSGALRLLENQGGNRNRSFRVRLAGRASNKNGVGAKVDIRAGSLRQRLETSAVTPAAAPADIVFGLGSRSAPDAVRVLWPSGIVQTETDEARMDMRTLRFEELDRKPSSCPYLYSWDGKRFGFVTDFMGGGEMGYRLGPGLWNTPIPEEYVRLDGDQLKPRSGRFELRVTNELEEALFFDRLKLMVVAHPADVEVFPNEGMAAAPRPPLRLYAVRGARPPSSALDDQERDMLARVSRLDRRFADGFGLLAVRGYAEKHALTLDLGPVAPERPILLLTGWTDYAFSSDNVAAQQAGLRLEPPSLEMQDDAGRWRTVIEDIGVPVGRPQTVVVDLAGRWLGRSRKVRVVTNMRIYWDRILMGSASEEPLQTTSLAPLSADLRERGFSEAVSPDAREPYSYDYSRVSRRSPWKAFPGRYTREGDVRELLAASDDLFVISRPGDEIALSFDAAAMPPLPAGWSRTYLLYADGFSKEMDINSASPHAVGPLPFHAMTRYPYDPPESYPMTAERAVVLDRYNTRVVASPLASLEAALAVARDRRER